MLDKIRRAINSQITLYDNGWCFRVDKLNEHRKILFDGRDVIICMLFILLIIK